MIPWFPWEVITWLHVAFGTYNNTCVCNCICCCIVFVFAPTGEMARWEVVDWKRHCALLQQDTGWYSHRIFQILFSVFIPILHSLFLLFQGRLQRQVDIPTGNFCHGFFKFIWSGDSQEEAGGSSQTRNRTRSQGVSCAPTAATAGHTARLDDTKALRFPEEKSDRWSHTAIFVFIWINSLQTLSFKNVYQNQISRSILWLCWFAC